MRQAVGLIAAWLFFGVLAAPPVDAFGASGSAASSAGGMTPSSQLDKAPLVILGAPTAAQQLQAEKEAKRASPEAARKREVSETAYERFGPRESQLLANRVQSNLVY